MMALSKDEEVVVNEFNFEGLKCNRQDVHANKLFVRKKSVQYTAIHFFTKIERFAV